MEVDAHQPNELNCQIRVKKTYLKARYRLSDISKLQRNDCMKSSLKRWIKTGAPYKGYLEKDSYRFLRQNYMQKERRLYPKKDGIVVSKKKYELKDLTQITKETPAKKVIHGNRDTSKKKFTQIQHKPS